MNGIILYEGDMYRPLDGFITYGSNIITLELTKYSSWYYFNENGQKTKLLNPIYIKPEAEDFINMQN